MLFLCQWGSRLAVGIMCISELLQAADMLSPNILAVSPPMLQPEAYFSQLLNSYLSELRPSGCCI
jgi:hypothetical protein